MLVSFQEVLQRIKSLIINTMYVTFSNYMGCPFTCLMASFKTHKFLNFDLQLINFSCIAYASGIISRKLLPNPELQRFSLIFSDFAALYVYSLY